MVDQALSVLVVDDDPLVLSAVSCFLQRRGMKTTCTDSPFGVSALVRKEAPDVIVLDCNMPGLDGPCLFQILRKNPRTAKTPIVFHSGNAVDGLAELAASLGARYAAKSQGLRSLVDTIVTAVRAPRGRFATIH